MYIYKFKMFHQETSVETIKLMKNVFNFTKLQTHDDITKPTAYMSNKTNAKYVISNFVTDKLQFILLQLARTYVSLINFSLE